MSRGTAKARGAEPPATPADWTGRRLHFVGIGGCGMSGLAIAAQCRGATVSGSDQSDTSYLPRLRERGITVTIPHRRSAVPPGAELVYSAVVPKDNVERLRADALGLRQRSRGDLLAELVADRRYIGVAGTHGKTTTTAMIAHCLRAADPGVGYLVGGDLLGTGRNADWGDENSWLVVETDESDRSALFLRPDIGVLTNVDHDHVKTFPTVGDVAAFFQQFLAQSGAGLAPPGFAASHPPGHVREHATGTVSIGRSGCVFPWRGQRVRVPLLGAHNAANAVAALETCVLAGMAPVTAAAALGTFAGTRRRFQHVGRTPAGADVYHDYAHHPTAIAATVTAARLLDPAQVVAVFEPWGSLRSQTLASAFGRALGLADAAIVLPHVGTVTEPFPGAATASLADTVRAAAPSSMVAAARDYRHGRDLVQPLLGPGTVCLVLGCGPVERFSPMLLCTGADDGQR